MTLNRKNCEAYLLETLEKCRGNITTSAGLLASPLRKPLMLALLTWAQLVPLTSESSKGMLYDMWISADEMAADWLRYLFRKGVKADKLYPSLTSLLNFLNAHSSRETVPYLMNCLRNYLICRLRRHQNGDGKIVTITRVSDDGTIEVIDPGDMEDTRSPDALAVILHREAMETFLRHMGEDLIQDICILSPALPISHHELAKLIFAGHHVAVCRELVRRVGNALQEDYSAAWEPFLAAAEAFVLPPRLQSVAALERHMYRKTDAKGRERFMKRVGSRPV